MRHEPDPSQDAEAQRFPLEPTPIHVPDEVLADLRRRLELTRWPDDAGNDDWYYGVLRTYLQELVDYWRTDYDWRKAEAAINAYEHYRVEVEGVPVHFMRRPGVGPNPTPLILTHGWPWTFWHWSKVIDPSPTRPPTAATRPAPRCAPTPTTTATHGPPPTTGSRPSRRPPASPSSATRTTRRQLCGPPFPQVALDRRGRSYRFSLGTVMCSLPGPTGL
jgi:hypothetical protein